MIMNGNTLIRIVAIISVCVLETVNLLTAKYDGALLLLIGVLIGTFAGLTINFWQSFTRL